jgi:hypothetical protein
MLAINTLYILKKTSTSLNYLQMIHFKPCTNCESVILMRHYRPQTSNYLFISHNCYDTFRSFMVTVRE